MLHNDLIRDESSFLLNVYMLCRKRVEKVPGYVEKKNWNDITTELTRFTYTLRESMLR